MSFCIRMQNLTTAYGFLTAASQRVKPKKQTIFEFSPSLQAASNENFNKRSVENGKKQTYR